MCRNMAISLLQPGVLSLVFLVALLSFTTGVSAFGPGVTSSNDACKWRHGDIENALLALLLSKSAGGTTFSKMDVKRVYFGNWLRDYSQLMDVGSLKVVGPGVLRTLASLFAFMTFGYATGEFEVTESRLGLYRPEEHIDNPKDYANNLDAKKYDKRLRGVIDEDIELSVDDRTGMKNYISNERLGITTTAGYLRKALGRCIKLGRQYKDGKNFRDLDDALRHLGNALHTMEDFPAHSNYIELALRELGERGVFAHVGTASEIEVRGHQVFPLVTGTFGSVDFLSNVLGGDPKNPGPSELQQMEQQMANCLELDAEHEGETKILRELFASLPKGLLNEKCIANLDHLVKESQAKQDEVKTKADDGEPVDLDSHDLTEQIYPFLEMHDRVVREIVYGMEEVPSHAATYEKIQESLCIVTFTLIAPYVLPVLQQARIELAESANEVIGISGEKEMAIFTDPYASDPVHSFLSKDHSSNVLSEPAGKVAVEIIKFTVPLIMRAWDEEDMDVDDLINYIMRIIHHPVCRDEGEHRGQSAMFSVVREWWTSKSDEEKEELRAQLGMDGIKAYSNRHGQDTGHGSTSPLAGVGIKPGDATGGIFTARKPEETVEVLENKEETFADVEKAATPEINTGDMNDIPDTANVAREEKVHKKKRDSRRIKDREGEASGSRSPHKRDREARRQRHGQSNETGDANVLLKDSKRRHRSHDDIDDKDLYNRHYDERDGRSAAVEKPKDARSRFSQMFSQGFNVFSLGGNTSQNETSDNRPSASGDDRRRREDRHERIRREKSRDTTDSPSRQRSVRKRERLKPDELLTNENQENRPPPPPDTADDTQIRSSVPANEEVKAGETIAEDRKPVRRRSSRKRDSQRDIRPPVEVAVIPEENDYFQDHHPEQDLPTSKAKASKILGVGTEENDEIPRRHKTKRRHTDREILEKKRYEEEPPVRAGFLGRMVSKADKILGRETPIEDTRQPERRKPETRDRDRDHKARKRQYPDDDERRQRKHRSVTLPVQMDPTDFAELPTPPIAPEVVENDIPGAFPLEDDAEQTKEEKRRHRKHKSSPAPLQFDVPSDGSGSDELKRSKSHQRKRKENDVPELQDVSLLAVESAPKSQHRRRQRDIDDTPTPSPRRDRRKKPVKEVNFEDTVDSGEASRSRERPRRHRSSRDELGEIDEVNGVKEKRKKDRKRDSAVYGGYGRE